jgi:molybdopterin synthase sulfur carrier subunit
MLIRVKLFANFRDGRFKEDSQEYPPGTDCRTIVKALGLTEGQIGIVLVNSGHAALSQVLEDGDTLALFPLIGGG